MFHFDRGLKLTSIDLAVDMRRRQPRGFISHAHADHMAPHELAYGTPATGCLYRHRLGKHRTFINMPYRQKLAWGDCELMTYPAGHVLGSSMLWASDGKRSLLYTGDFKLDDSATAERCELPHAEILIMESTWGDPKFRLPPRQAVIQQLLNLVHDCFRLQRTPVIHAYVVGKAQEVTKLLTSAGIPVLQHPLVFEVSEIYKQCGCDLGDYKRYPGCPLPGHAVVAPVRTQKNHYLPNLARPTAITVTGWGVDQNGWNRWNSDHVVPLSDHADFDQLFTTIDTVDPEIVYCTHGPASFVDHVRARGRKAVVLGAREQLPLF